MQEIYLFENPPLIGFKWYHGCLSIVSESHIVEFTLRETIDQDFWYYGII